MPGQIKKLNAEIQLIENKIAADENEIRDSTDEIGSLENSLVAELKYRPIIKWAETISQRSPTDRELTFEQTSRGGYLGRRSPRCRPFGYSTHGWWYRIRDRDSTGLKVKIGALSVTPKEDGLEFSNRLSFEGTTAVEGKYRPVCLPWTPRVNARISARASANTVFGLNLKSDDLNKLAYALDLKSPNQINLRMSVGLGRIGNIRFRVPIKNVARNLAKGELDLLFKNNGNVELPNGDLVTYSLEMANTSVKASKDGVKAAADIEIQFSD
ncbi:MAG: hypothetical protein ABJO88_16875 [Parasphingorhabdus sp.]